MSDSKFKYALREIQMIRPERLPEREFYHRIIEALARLGDQTLLSEEEMVKLQEEIQRKGCYTYEEFKFLKAMCGEKILTTGSMRGDVERGEIVGAIALIDQVLKDPQNGRFFISYMNEGQRDSLSYKWLQASRRRMDVNKYYKRKTEDLNAFQRLPGEGGGGGGGDEPLH